jgi:hypothetical protein
MMKLIFYRFVSSVLLTMLTINLAAKMWPVIQPLEEKCIFTDVGKNSADTPFTSYIKDATGSPIYKLECHNGNYEDQSVMNFSGDFQCALFAMNGKIVTSGNLLAANTKNELSSSWWNRGRMRSVQLRGDCLRYPEYSTDRHFRLRGMLVNLRFTNAQWSTAIAKEGNPLLSGFTFIFSAFPEKSNRAARAEEVASPEPPKSCYP